MLHFISSLSLLILVCNSLNIYNLPSDNDYALSTENSYRRMLQQTMHFKSQQEAMNYARQHSQRPNVPGGGRIMWNKPSGMSGGMGGGSMSRPFQMDRNGMRVMNFPNAQAAQAFVRHHQRIPNVPQGIRWGQPDLSGMPAGTRIMSGPQIMSGGGRQSTGSGSMGSLPMSSNAQPYSWNSPSPSGRG